MANILLGDEEKATLVLANTCVAFALLTTFSPETSRPYLLAAATALGLLSLYPLFLILQRPRRFMVARETEGDKSVFILRYKGYLWWYDATDRKGNAIVFNTLEEAQKFITEDLVTAMISDKMWRKSLKREFEVVLDSRKMVAKTTPYPGANNLQGQQKRKDASRDPQPGAAQPEEEEREEIVPDNNATIAGMYAMGKADRDENEEEENGKGDAPMEKGDARECKGASPPEQRDDRSSGKDAPHGDGNDTRDGNGEEEQEETDDLFRSDYPAPVDDAEDGNLSRADAPGDGRENGSEGTADTIDAETFNAQLFDVMDAFNKSANKRKPPARPGSQAQPPAAGEQQEVAVVTTAQVVEDQALVHAHKAEMVKDALGKILFHQQMVDLYEEEKKDGEKKTTVIPKDRKTQAVPKSRSRKDRSPDGIPTKSIQYRPSSEEKVLKRQLSLLEMPGFVAPEEKKDTGNDGIPKSGKADTGDAQHQGEPAGDATEKSSSTGGAGRVRELPPADHAAARSPAEAGGKDAPRDVVTERRDAVPASGPGKQEGTPRDDGNGRPLPDTHHTQKQLNHTDQ